MSDQSTSLFSSPGSGSGTGLGGAATQPLDGPKRRELTWHRGADLGLVLLRLAVGGVFLAHGAQKVFGLWGGQGMAVFADNLGRLGFGNHTALAWATAVAELVGGAAVVLGLFTPLAAAGLMAIAIDAVLLKAGNGFFISGPPGAQSVELNVVLGLAAAAIVLIGPGRFALDNGRTWQRRPAPWGLLCLAIGVAVALLVFFLLRAR
jgi:putative oxidoreductase